MEPSRSTSLDKQITSIRSEAGRTRLPPVVPDIPVCG
jgi:hypothetical protein